MLRSDQVLGCGGQLLLSSSQEFAEKKMETKRMAVPIRVGLKLVFLVIVVAMVIAAFQSLPLTPLKVVVSVLIAGGLFAATVWQIRRRPSSANAGVESPWRRLANIAVTVLIGLAAYAIFMWRPGTIAELKNVAWPILSVALYVFFLAVASLFRH